MKLSYIVMEVAERLDLHPRTVYEVVDAIGEIFLAWAEDADDDRFPLGMLGLFCKVQGKVRWRGSKFLKSEQQ